MSKDKTCTDRQGYGVGAGNDQVRVAVDDLASKIGITLRPPPARVSLDCQLFHAVQDKLQDELIYLYILVAIFIILCVAIGNMIGGRSLHDIVVERFRSWRQKPGRRFLSVTPINVIDCAIYGVNIVLIIMAVLFYAKYHSIPAPA
jgi:hypothetical protein